MLALLAAARAAPEIHEPLDALVLGDSGDAELAARWFFDHRDDDPTSARNLWRGLRLLSYLPEWRQPGLPAQVDAWAAAHPDAGDVGIARLYASFASRISPTVQGTPLFHAPDPAWCADAAAFLAVLPEEPTKRMTVLETRGILAGVCDQPTDAIDAESAALALSGAAGPGYRLLESAKDGLDEAEAEELPAVVAEARWLRNLAGLAHADQTGPGAPAAREALLAAARAAAATDRIGAVDAAARVFARAALPEEQRQALEHLVALAPDNREFARRYEAVGADPVAPPEPADPAAPPDASTVVNAAERCAALGEQRPPDGWAGQKYWAALADCSEALGDRETATRATEHQWREGRSARDATRFGEAALRSELRLRQARKAVDEAVTDLLEAERYVLGADDGWAERLAHLLVVRADLDAALGDAPWPSMVLALRVGGPAPDRVLRLGLAYADSGADDLAAPLLGRALATLPPDDPRAAPTREVLEGLLQDFPGWPPTVDEYVAGSAPPAAPAEALPQPDLAGLEIDVDGVAQELLAIEGPLVVDLWATWCGPCMESLPHLDALSRRYAGRATFLAVSVDDEQAVAERYLAKRGETSFVRAWSKDAMKRFGVQGIPATFVLDADHRVVAAIDGWGPGDARLDEALLDLLGPPDATAGLPKAP